MLNGSNMVAGVAVCEQPHFLHNARFSQEVGTTHPEESNHFETFHFSYTATKISTVIVTSSKQVAPDVTITRASVGHLTNPPYYPQYRNVLDCVWSEGYYASSEHSYNASTVYHTSNPFYLPASARLCVKATGSNGCSILTVWDTYGNFVSSTAGNWDRWDRNFIAESDCYVTVSRRVTATTVTYTDSHSGETVSFAGPYFSDNDNGDNPPIVYVNSYLSESPLHGKKMLVIGDSLIYGHDVGNAITWSNLLAMKYGMTVDNQGINGSTVAVVSGKTTYPMCVRYANIETANPDIVIVEGGANDRNNRVPIGTNLDTDLSTFKGALNVLIDGLRNKYPRAVIMMMTTYHRLRTGNNNTMFDELLYAAAMMEVCEYKGVPCYNNMMSGIDLSNADIRAWADEDIWLGKAEPSYHFSESAYKALAPQYEKWIESFIPYE